MLPAAWSPSKTALLSRHECDLLQVGTEIFNMTLAVPTNKLQRVEVPGSGRDVGVGWIRARVDSSIRLLRTDAP